MIVKTTLYAAVRNVETQIAQAKPTAVAQHQQKHPFPAITRVPKALTAKEVWFATAGDAEITAVPVKATVLARRQPRNPLNRPNFPTQGKISIQ